MEYPVKFYICSVGDPTKEYARENLNRIINNTAFILHKNTTQKGVYGNIEPGDILLLKYDGNLVAYGKAVGNQIKVEDGWNLWTNVEKWIFKNSNDPEEGISYHGIQGETIAGGPYGTVKEISGNFGWQKLQEIDNTTLLFFELKKQLSTLNQKTNVQDIINLLEYKKQIILQGPPGTGKTFNAKLIANALVGLDGELGKSFPTIEYVKKSLSIGERITFMAEDQPIIVVELKDSTVTIKFTNNRNFYVSYKRIAECIKTQNFAGKAEDIYPSAIGKYLFNKWSENIDGNTEEVSESKGEVKLIQFHPAYSYEDFVRGITAKSNGASVEYRTENKILAEFANKALNNYLDSKKEPAVISNEIWIKEQFEQFVRYIEPEFANEKGYPLNEAVSIFDLDDDGAFRYTGHNWIIKSMHRMKASDVINIYLSGATSNSAVKKLKNINGSAHQHATYYLILANHFRKFLNGKTPPAPSKDRATEKKYVLIIDEINRANLPAVLGELIYALEYRGEPVESMYDLDGDRNLILPPNLYIIGTMNTADRSVGHIDYAIRRRFAFVDILPSEQPVHSLARLLFKQVSELFIKNYEALDWSDPQPERSDYLASDFRPEDVWIGHSYFISDKKTDDDVRADLNLKLKYEILPLLKEYIKDGLLMSNAADKIKALHV